MSRTSYLKALDDLLRPLGFERGRREWVRIRGDIEERLDLQKSWIDGGVTVNVWAKDLETEKILNNIPCELPLGIIQFGVRIGHLIDGRDRWWRNDPNGPEELAEAVRVYGVPWFDRVLSVEEEAVKSPYRGTQIWRNPNLPALAVTLYRVGRLEEALALFEAPVPKTAMPSLVTRGRCVQRWLKGQVRSA